MSKIIALLAALVVAAHAAAATGPGRPISPQCAEDVEQRDLSSCSKFLEDHAAGKVIESLIMMQPCCKVVQSFAYEHCACEALRQVMDRAAASALSPDTARDITETAERLKSTCGVISPYCLHYYA